VRFGDGYHYIQGGPSQAGGDLLLGAADDMWFNARWVRFNDTVGTAGEYGRIAYNGSWINSNLAVTGTVTAPNQPAFFAYKDGPYNETSGVNTITGWTEEFDRGSNFNATGNARFTAPVAGVYQFNFNAMSGQTSGDVQFQIHKNGTNYAGSNSMAQGGGPWRQTCVAAVISMALNDYVEFRAYSSQSSSTVQLYTGRCSHVSGHLIG
jgi:hypothetical protein